MAHLSRQPATAEESKRNLKSIFKNLPRSLKAEKFCPQRKMTHCIFAECTKRANFANSGEKAKFCAQHKEPQMINTNNRTCAEEKCSLRPNFGNPGEKPKFCCKHKEPQMINVNKKICAEETCLLEPYYGNFGGKAIFCTKHKTEGMVDLKTRKCAKEMCFKKPTFSNPGEKAKFCAQHKTEAMVNVVSQSCASVACSTRASYANPGEKAKFCAQHKTEAMVNVVNKHCDAVGCSAIPNYGMAGEKAKFCVKHKTEVMIDLRSKRCADERCSTVAGYAYPGEKAKFCVKHKIEGMVCVRGKICEAERCLRQCNYANPGEKAKFCRAHKEPQMIDVSTKHCDAEKCGATVQYGTPGHGLSRCSKHRAVGMRRKPNARCLMCPNAATHGVNGRAVRCCIHALETDLNMLDRPCTSCGLLYVLDRRGFCENCEPNRFKKARLAKQCALTDYLDSRGLPGSQTDRIVDGGDCGKERPDRVYLDAEGRFVLILEVDENQHFDRACECEQTRMVNIGQMFGGTPVYFVRWNPDSYTPGFFNYASASASASTSSQKQKSDSEEPKKMCQVPLRRRTEMVGDLIEAIMTGRMFADTQPVNGALICALYMYFDGFTDMHSEPWRRIL
jgi:hypothetical protein